MDCNDAMQCVFLREICSDCRTIAPCLLVEIHSSWYKGRENQYTSKNFNNINAMRHLGVGTVTATQQVAQQLPLSTRPRTTLCRVQRWFAQPKLPDPAHQGRNSTPRARCQLPGLLASKRACTLRQPALSGSAPENFYIVPGGPTPYLNAM